MERIVWDDPEDPINDNEIEKVEKDLGVHFPLDYIEVAKKYHGANPIPSRFYYGEGFGGYLDRLLSFDPEEYESVQRLSLEFLKDDETPDKIIPFGIDAAGNLICFDYNTNEHKPTVVYWLHEENKLAYICGTFTELLDKLSD